MSLQSVPNTVVSERLCSDQPKQFHYFNVIFYYRGKKQQYFHN